MTRRQRWILVLVIVLFLVVIDQTTKRIAINLLQDAPRYDYFGGFFSFVYAENTGAFLSLGSKLSPTARFWTLTALNGVILGIVFLFLIFKHTLRTPVVAALACIFAGGIGNLIDRILRDGHVVDFMNMGISIGPYSLRTGIFNVADVAIMAGLFLLVGLEIFTPKKPDTTHPDTNSAPPQSEN